MPKMHKPEHAKRGQSMNHIFSGQTSWILPLSIDDFIRQQWGAKPFITTVLLERLRVLNERSGWSLDAILADATGPISVFLQNRERPHEQVEVAASEAMSLYRAGMSLYIPNVSRFRWVADEAAAALGVPPERVSASIFASRRGNRTHFHFDSNENFTMQLAGHKVWSVAPNSHAEFPLRNWLGNESTLRNLREYARGPIPAAGPEQSQTFALEPSSVLYVPRGHWHATDTTEEDSISLNISMQPLYWCEVILDRLYALMIAERDFRATAFGWAGGERKKTSLRATTAALTLGGLVAKLTHSLSVLAPSVLLGQTGSGEVFTEEPTPLLRFRRNPFASLAVEGLPDKSGQTRTSVQLRELNGDDRLTVIELDPDSLRVACFLAELPIASSVSVEELVRQGWLTDENDVTNFMNDLIEIGLIYTDNNTHIKQNP